jgi:hypothetical protein
MPRVDHLKCGDCGGSTFYLRHIQPEGASRFGGGGSPAGGRSEVSEVEGSIRVVCVKCSSVSVIGTAPATLTTKGNLCGGWSTRKPSAG